jgi:predicted glycosyltransferase
MVFAATVVMGQGYPCLRDCPARSMRIWFDMTAPAHPLVFRPVIARLREAGHDVSVTARDYAQTLPLLVRLGIPHVAVGRHGGASRTRKLGALVSRTPRLRAWAARGHFDLAVAHGSNDLALAAAALRIPAVNTFDYEWASTQHQIGCRLARRVMVPEAIPPGRLRRYGVDDGKLRQYPGLKEEYYLADFEPDPGELARLGADPRRVLVVVRPPPDVSLYHRKSNRLFPAVLAALGRRDDVHAVVIPRTEAQRDYVRSLRFPSLLVPEGAVDAQSLIAAADLVVSAGGTMNREAVALGTPVYTTYGGRLGGVDEALIREHRLRPLTDPRAMELVKRDPAAQPRVRRDPGVLAAWMLEVATA